MATSTPKTVLSSLALFGVASGLMVTPAPRLGNVVRATFPRTATIKSVTASSMVETPADTYHMIANKGEALSKMSVAKTLHSSIMGGLQVGLGGLLCLTVCGNMGGVAMSNPGLVKFTFAALFPVCLVLVVGSGTQLYTGNTASMMSAYWEKKVKLPDVLKSWVISFIGNFIGCAGLAFVGAYTGILSGGAATFAAALGPAKCGGGFGRQLVKGILCNYLVCMAIFLATQARDMMGKYIGIAVPISTFVATGYEHSVANLFLLPAAILAGSSLTVGEAIVKNLIPVTIGNAIAGALLIGASFSYSYGALGGTPRD